MDFREKIRLLVGTQNKSDLSRRAGLPPAALDAVINKGREPLATNAAKMAKASRLIPIKPDDKPEFFPVIAGPFRAVDKALAGQN